MDLKKTNQIEHVWSMLCQTSSIDYQTNEVSLLRIIEEFNLEAQAKDEDTKRKLENMEKEAIEFPINVQLFSMWQREEKMPEKSDKARIKVVWIDPRGQELQSLEYDLQIPEDKIRMRYRINLGSIKLSVDGRYKFRVALGKEGSSEFEQVVEIPVDVKIKVIQ